MNRLTKVVVVCLSFLVFAYVGLGYVLGKSSDEKAYRSLTVYGEVLQRVQQDYVEEPNMQLVTAGALHGLLEALDPQSSYLSPREYAEYKQKLQSGAKGEVGAALSKRFGYIIVVAVLPDSPAQKAGLRSGDILESIAGFTTREMSIGQALNLVAGSPGTTVKVSVVRRGRGEPQEVEMVRAELGPMRVLTEKVDPGIAYLRVDAFDAGKADEIREKLQQLERQGIQKLVLDLRDCARGEVSEAIAVARLFVPSGTLATLRGQAMPEQEYSAEPGKVAWKHPMTVLISNSTSGAAEVLAAAIGGNQRGPLVGERTFGTASEQKLIPLEDGAALVLTVADYYTPSGKSISDEGVAPTVEVRAALGDQADLGDDNDSETESVPPATARPVPADDPVLRKAIELLKGAGQKAAWNVVAPRPWMPRAVEPVAFRNSASAPIASL